MSSSEALIMFFHCLDATAIVFLAEVVELKSGFSLYQLAREFM